MFGSVQDELDFACELLRVKGVLMHERFHGAKLRVKKKPDGSKVTDLDELLSEEIVEEYERRDTKVVRRKVEQRLMVQGTLLLSTLLTGRMTVLKGRNVGHAYR